MTKKELREDIEEVIKLMYNAIDAMEASSTVLLSAVSMLKSVCKSLEPRKRAPYNLSDEERKRRSEHGQRLGRSRAEAVVEASKKMHQERTHDG